MNNDRVMPFNVQAKIKKWYLAYLGLKLAILATFFKISTLNLFCPAFTIRLKGKPNKKSIGLKITSLASKKPHKWPYLNSFFSKWSITKRLVTSATIDIFP